MELGATGEARDAERLLAGLESGAMATDEAAAIAERIDPVLHYAIVRFLRAVYPASNPAAASVLERVVRLSASRPSLVRRYDEGKRDPVSRWFEGSHEYRDFRGRGPAMIALLMEKLES